MDACVTKPFTKSQLVEVVDGFVSRAHTQQARLALSAAPEGAVRGSAGPPDNDASLAVLRKLVKLLADALLNDGSADADIMGSVGMLRCSRSDYLETLRWACSVLGSHDILKLSDGINLRDSTGTPAGTPAAGWGAGLRAKAPAAAASSSGSKSPMVATLRILRGAVARRDAEISELGYLEVATLAAVNMQTVREAPWNMASTFLSHHSSLMSTLLSLHERGEWNEYERRAHSLKSSAEWVGANNLSRTAAALEQVVKLLRAGGAQLALVKHFEACLAVDIQLVLDALQKSTAAK